MTRLSYFVCFGQRSGSNLLCEVLSGTRVAGKPGEYFLPHFSEAETLGVELAGFERSVWARRRGVSSFAEFLDVVDREATTPNGIFGAKLAWNSLEAFLRKFRDIPGYRNLSLREAFLTRFERPRFIHLQRRDRVRQAVSWALAAQTGHYSAEMAETRQSLREPMFDVHFLDGLYRLIREGEAGWSSFFEDAGAEPLRLDYEDMVEDLQGTVRCVLSWLGVPFHDDLDVSSLQFRRQASVINDEWTERYRAARPGA